MKEHDSSCADRKILQHPPRERHADNPNPTQECGVRALVRLKLQLNVEEKECVAWRRIKTDAFAAHHNFGHVTAVAVPIDFSEPLCQIIKTLSIGNVLRKDCHEKNRGR
jgi:hypothetical protein